MRAPAIWDTTVRASPVTPTARVPPPLSRRTLPRPHVLIKPLRTWCVLRDSHDRLCIGITATAQLCVVQGARDGPAAGRPHHRTSRESGFKRAELLAATGHDLMAADVNPWPGALTTLIALWTVEAHCDSQRSSMPSRPARSPSANPFGASDASGPPYMTSVRSST